MEAMLSHQPLNAIQLHLLKMFSVTKNEDSLKELQMVLFDYYQNKLNYLRLKAEGFINRLKPT